MVIYKIMKIWLFIALHKLGTKAVCVCMCVCQILCKLITGKQSTFLKQSLLLAFICLSTLAKNMAKMAIKCSGVGYSLAEFLCFFVFLAAIVSVGLQKPLFWLVPCSFSRSCAQDHQITWYVGTCFPPDIAVLIATICQCNFSTQMMATPVGDSILMLLW